MKDKSLSSDSLYPTTGSTSIFERLKDEILERSTEKEVNAFAVSRNRAEAGDYTEAIQSIKSLAFGGNVYAQMLLYEYNNLLDQPKEAIMWLQRASKQHHPFADFLLGAAYAANNENNSKTITEGQVLLVKSAKKGLVDAQYVLGMWGINSYKRGGDQRQYDMGIRMLRMAADQDYQPAKEVLMELGVNPE